MSQPQCPKCGETYYVEWLGTLPDYTNGYHCDICEIEWTEPATVQEMPHDAEDLAWLEWHISQRR